MSLLLGTFTLLLAPFCMHICRIISSSPIVMPLGREEYIIGIFLVCLSVLSVRIILDTAYSRNMAGSWARDWENLFRVSFLNLPKWMKTLFMKQILFLDIFVVLLNKILASPILSPTRTVWFSYNLILSYCVASVFASNWWEWVAVSLKHTGLYIIWMAQPVWILFV